MQQGCNSWPGGWLWLFSRCQPPPPFLRPLQVATGVILALSFKPDSSLPSGAAVAALVREGKGGGKPGARRAARGRLARLQLFCDWGADQELTPLHLPPCPPPPGPQVTICLFIAVRCPPLPR